jgi:signal transduction histidine kinase
MAGLRVIASRSRIAVPAIAGLLSLLATIALWQATRRDRRVQLAVETTRATSDLVGHLLSHYNHERQQIILMGAQLASAPESWAQWSRPYLVGQPIHRSVLWIDRQLIVRHVEGEQEDALRTRDLGVDPARAAALHDAASTHEQVALRADDLRSGRITLMIAQPVYTRDGFIGFTAALLDIDTLLRLTIAPHEETGFGITVRADDRLVYESAGSGRATPDGALARRSMRFGPLTLAVDIWPTPAHLAYRRFDVSILTLVFGLLVTMLLTLTIAAAQTAHRRSAAIERANHLLAAEVGRRQQAQHELQQMAAELTRSNRELQDVASIASHDLRAPLQKIKSFADLLAEEYASPLDDLGRDVLERLRRSVHRMTRLVDDLLELARVRATARPFTRVDLSQVAQEVASDLEPALRVAGGRIEIGALPVIDADPTQMHQLLQNLAANGLKFQRAGDVPVVRIEASVIEHHAGGPPLCRLRVSDNGIGFDNQHAERIFRPFERLHGQQEYEGSGMGLAVCARIAERHGGTIAAYGVRGQGASFLVTLPVRHAPTQPGQMLVETADIEKQPAKEPANLQFS